MKQEQKDAARCPLCRSHDTQYRRFLGGGAAGGTRVVAQCNDCQCTFLTSFGPNVPGPSSD